MRAGPLMPLGLLIPRGPQLLSARSPLGRCPWAR